MIVWINWYVAIPCSNQMLLCIRLYERPLHSSGAKLTWRNLEFWSICNYFCVHGTIFHWYPVAAAFLEPEKLHAVGLKVSRPWLSATLINAFPSPQHHSRAHKLNPETLHSFLTQNTCTWSRSITPDPIRLNPITCTYLSLVLVPCLSLPLICYLYLSLVPSIWHS